MELNKRGPTPPLGSWNHIGPRGILRWPRLLKGSWLMTRPPSEDPVAELATLACWPTRLS